MADAGRIKTDVLGLQTKLSKIGRYRTINLSDIKKSIGLMVQNWTKLYKQKY